MGISCKKDIGKSREKTLKKKPRNTGADAGNGGVPVITNENNWAVMNFGKNIVHKFGLKHESVHIVIISGDGRRILLQQRGKAKKQWKEYWDIVGEHMIFGDRTPQYTAESVLKEELGKNWRNPKFTFDIEVRLEYTIGKDKEQVTKVDNEIRHVYVIIADDINETAVETMNKEYEKIEETKQETIQFKWFDKEEFDRYLSAEKIVPYFYWQNCQLFDNFKTFFKEKVKELRAKDLEDVSR